MAFKKVGKWTRNFGNNRLEIGESSIRKNGSSLVLSATVYDLKKAGISEKVVIMVDVAGRKIALRKPKKGEEYRCLYSRSKTAASKRVCAMTAMRSMGITREKGVGRYKISLQGGSLVIDLKNKIK